MPRCTLLRLRPLQSKIEKELGIKKNLHNSGNSCTFARRNHCEKFRNEKFRNHNYLIMNPFKFGTIV